MYEKYSPEWALKPIWSGNEAINESVMFIGGRDTAVLLYDACEIISVMSTDHKIVYKEGVDYALDNGCLRRLSGSSIPSFPLEEYYPAEHRDGHDFGCTVEGHPYLVYGENDTFISMQVDVTYRHCGKWNGRIPEDCSGVFKHFHAKLKAGIPATILFYGDSITTGCNSTGTFGCAPYLPSFPYMITSAIADKYSYTASFEVDPHINPDNLPKPLEGERVLHYINTAVGGMDARWGLENVDERVNKYNPDLVVLAFGMNDGWKTPEEFMLLTTQTIERIHEVNPECEICIVSTMLPHYRAAGFFVHQIEYEPCLEKYAAEHDYVAVAPMTSVHSCLLERKEYYDMTGNNVNHCNDYLARVYAMTILRTIDNQG